MPTNNITFHRRARWALDQATESERAEVHRALASLLRKKPEQWPGDRVQVVPNQPTPLYNFRATPEVRVFFTFRGSEEVEVLDVIREDTYQFLHNQPDEEGVV